MGSKGTLGLTGKYDAQASYPQMPNPKDALQTWFLRKEGTSEVGVFLYLFYGTKGSIASRHNGKLWDTLFFCHQEKLFFPQTSIL